MPIEVIEVEASKFDDTLVEIQSSNIHACGEESQKASM